MFKAMVPCAALLVAVACGGNKNNTAATDTAGGAMAAPATATPSAMPSDTLSGTAAGSTSTPAAGTTGTAGMDTTGRAGTAGTADTMNKARTSGATAKAGTSAHDQTQSGVTNAKTGHSTLGPNIKKTSPTQGQAVTSKGDTLRKGGDTTSHQ